MMSARPSPVTSATVAFTPPANPGKATKSATTVPVAAFTTRTRGLVWSAIATRSSTPVSGGVGGSITGGRGVTVTVTVPVAVPPFPSDTV
jgi:hypothetical protein